MADLMSRLYPAKLTNACEACVFERGEHAAFCGKAVSAGAGNRAGIDEPALTIPEVLAIGAIDLLGFAVRKARHEGDEPAAGK